MSTPIPFPRMSRVLQACIDAATSARPEYGTYPLVYNHPRWAALNYTQEQYRLYIFSPEKLRRALAMLEEPVVPELVPTLFLIFWDLTIPYSKNVVAALKLWVLSNPLYRTADQFTYPLRVEESQLCSWFDRNPAYTKYFNTAHTLTDDADWDVYLHYLQQLQKALDDLGL